MYGIVPLERVTGRSPAGQPANVSWQVRVDPEFIRYVLHLEHVG